MTGPFYITVSPRLPGARLSLHGSWGNRPFPSEEAAVVEAERIGGPGVVIRRERGR